MNREALKHAAVGIASIAMVAVAVIVLDNKDRAGALTNPTALFWGFVIGVFVTLGVRHYCALKEMKESAIDEMFQRVFSQEM